MMRVVVKVLGFAVAAWAVLGFVFRDHPLLGTLYLGLRVPLLLVCFLLGGWAGWLVYRSSPAYARRLRANLFNALGREDDAVLRAAVAEAGRQALELPWIWLRPAAEVVASAVRTEGWELVEQARADGAGILFITPHLGCFEITAQCIAAQIPITVLYRPPRKPGLQPLMEAGRARGQMRTAPADLAGVRKLVKTLRSHEAVGMLPDQVPGAGEEVESGWERGAPRSAIRSTTSRLVPTLI